MMVTPPTFHVTRLAAAGMETTLQLLVVQLLALTRLL